MREPPAPGSRPHEPARPAIPELVSQPTHPAAALQRVQGSAPRSIASHDVLTLQRTVGNRAVQRLLATQRQDGGASGPPGPAPASAHGLPADLQAGVEALSGVSMEDVSVHRNSSRPAALRARAYARGNEIHLGPGEERSLPHEAWHVVQQKQGRVPVTTQLQGVGINDNPGLERDADRMGERASSLGAASVHAPEPVLHEAPTSAVQRLPVVQRRLMAAVLTSRAVFDRVSPLVEGARNLTMLRTNATTWTITPPVGGHDWTVLLTNNGVLNHTVNAGARTLTIDFGNANIPDLPNGGVDVQAELDLEQEATERIDRLITEHILQPVDPAYDNTRAANAQVGLAAHAVMNGVFLAGSVDNDPTHVNHIDGMKLARLSAVADLYLTAYNTLNAANIAANAPAPAHGAAATLVAARAAANVAFARLSNLVASMQLATPAKLTALHGQTAVAIAAPRLSVIDSVAKHQEFQAFEAATGNLGHPGALTHETVGHLLVPEERTTAVAFQTLGIGGGHVDSTFKEFVAASAGRYRVELVQQRPVVFTAPAALNGRRMTLRLYTQYMQDPANIHGWIRSNVKKSTTDNLNLFLYAAKAGLVTWLGAPNVMPGNNQSFGRFSGNAQAPVSHAGTGVDLGGYGTRGLLSDQDEIKTLFVTDEWFYHHMATDIAHHMPDQAHPAEITAAFEAQTAVRRAAILLGLQQQVYQGHYTSGDDKLTKVSNLEQLDACFVTVSGLAAKATQALGSKKSGVRNQQITVNLAHVRDAEPSVADQYRIFTGNPQPISKNVETRLYDLKRSVKTLQGTYATRVATAQAQRTILTALATYNQLHP